MGLTRRRVYCEACEYENAVRTELVFAGGRYATVGCPHCKFNRVVIDDMFPENVGTVLTRRCEPGNMSYCGDQCGCARYCCFHPLAGQRNPRMPQ